MRYELGGGAGVLWGPRKGVLFVLAYYEEALQIAKFQGLALANLKKNESQGCAYP